MALYPSCSRSSAESERTEADSHGRGAAVAARAEPVAGVAAAAQPKACAEHGVAESECAICRPDDALRLAAGQSMKVRLPHAGSAGLVGVTVAPAEAAPWADGIGCFAEITFDQNRLTHLTVPTEGIIHQTQADLGDQLGEGQVLASVSSAEITATVARAILTHQTLERERRLRAGQVNSEQALQEAEALHRAACQQALTYGFTESRIEELGRDPSAPVYFELRAPFAGEVVERSAIRGARVVAGGSLFVLADRSSMWAMLQVPESELAQVRVGQPVEVQVEALPGRVFRGRLTWIAAAIDPQTRLCPARAEIANADGQLRDRMFGRARIVVRSVTSAILVPAGAVQRVEGRAFVFVQREAALFEARAVETGAMMNGCIEIRTGLAVAEPVAITQAYAIKSAMLMSRLGEGCADD